MVARARILRHLDAVNRNTSGYRSNGITLLCHQPPRETQRANDRGIRGWRSACS